VGGSGVGLGGRAVAVGVFCARVDCGAEGGGVGESGAVVGGMAAGCDGRAVRVAAIANSSATRVATRSTAG
jgi:hypothetical protein